MDKRDDKSLKKRYLAWLYKNTKEAFDRYERKFTQMEIDEFILKEMERELRGAYLPHEKKALEKYINDFRRYINAKEEQCLKLKYKGKKMNPEFIFLDVKLEAIEKAITRELGGEALSQIKDAYEGQMLKRIWEEKQENKR